MRGFARNTVSIFAVYRQNFKGCKACPAPDRPHRAPPAHGTAAMTQQALAARLGISASYLNLIEHDQRNVTASLLIKLAETLQVDLAALSGSAGARSWRRSCARCFADPLLGAERVPEAEVAALAAAARTAARAVLALYRAWRVAREDSRRHRAAVRPAHPAAERGGAGLLRRPRQPFPAAGGRRRGASSAELRRRRSEMNHAIAERLRGPWPDRDGAAAGRRAARLRRRRRAR